MIFQLLRRGARRQTIDALYGAIVAQARHPAFYRDFAVPDTVEGRFDMIVLHVVLFLRRVRREPADIRALGQRVFDRFCRDMDHNLREMGVGDLAVPKRMRDLGEAFYGRAQTYDGALACNDPAVLAATLARNVFAEMGVPSGAHRLAAYVAAAERRLAAQEGATLAVTVDFPDPTPISGEQASQ